MLKKIILLFLISSSLQLNLFSCEVEYINKSVTKCFKCSSTMRKLEQYSNIFECENEKCRQGYSITLSKSDKFRKFKYLIPMLVCSVIVWKYNNQIKKFLFGKYLDLK